MTNTTDSLSYKIIKEASKEEVKTREDLFKVKRKVHKENKASKFPTNISLLEAYRDLVKKGELKKSAELQDLLITKRMRSLSGVSVITVLTKPYPCPGKCIYCPTETGVPKSYLSNEPAVMRAILCKYDPKKQVEVRLKSLEKQGHPTEKIELIVIGGTFSYLKKEYQEEFIKECLEGLNEVKSKDLIDAQKKNETSKHRMVGLTLETRPDYIDKKEVEWFRKLGATRVELGVQSLDNEVLDKVKRGHSVEETGIATKLLKDAGFKICYHMMPNLPGSDVDKDKKMFKELFSSSHFKPDYIKIYPCMVIKGTGLYKIWKDGKYRSYTDEELMGLVKDVKKNVPYYVRIKRVIRDIPAVSISSGSVTSNLRQILEDSKKRDGWKCKCIRCREIKDQDRGKEILLFREDYDASEGKEIFLSFEDKERGKLYSLLRLRITKDQTLDEIKDSALVREVHTYGKEIKVGEKGNNASQHKGLGQKLIKEAEKIAKEEYGFKKIAIISGVGVRKYYESLGYVLNGTYMVKEL